MFFRTQVFMAAVLALWSGGALADKLPLNDISRYINSLKTVKTPFTQINGDGSISTGQIYIKRPGRMRFEYDEPEGTVVVASANAVVVADQKSNLPPETYPLRRTPLKLILDRNVNLGRTNMVVGHSFDGTATVVVAQDPEHPEYGNIAMKFTADPIELRQWVINDANGGQTTVVLGALEKVSNLSSKLFDGEALRRRGQ